MKLTIPRKEEVELTPREEIIYKRAFNFGLLLGIVCTALTFVFLYAIIKGEV